MMAFYKHNAFRILGVPANSNCAAVRDAQQSLRTRARVRDLSSINDPLSFLNTVERSESSIRNAFNRLENLQSRLRERLFWFVNSTPADGQAIAQLTAKNLKGAVKTWQSTKGIQSSANLARFYHAFCIAKNPDAEKPQWWKAALGKWCATLGSDDFWEQFIDAEIESGFEPLATISDIQSLREESWEIVLKPSSVFLQQAISEEKYDVARRHLNLIRASGFPLRTKTRIEAEVLDSLEHQAKKAADEIYITLDNVLKDKELSLEARIEECNHAYHRYKSEVFQQVEQLAHIGGLESESFKRARETSASCLRDISVMGYHNRANAYQVAERILKEAISLIPESHLAQRWEEEDLPILEENANRDRFSEILEPVKETSDSISQQLLGALENEDNEAESKRKFCDQAYYRFKNSLLEQLEKLVDQFGVDSEVVKKARETAASCLRDISVMGYHNRANAYQVAERILKEAISLIPESHLAQRWEEKDLPILEENAENERIDNTIRPIAEFCKSITDEVDHINERGKSKFSHKRASTLHRIFNMEQWSTFSWRACLARGPKDVPRSRSEKKAILHEALKEIEQKIMPEGALTAHFPPSRGFRLSRIPLGGENMHDKAHCLFLMLIK